MCSPNTVVKAVPFSAVEIDDNFWSPRLETNRKVTIEYQYEKLHESGMLDNFRCAAAGESGKISGMWFQDSDAYMWLEAARYVLATEDDPNLEEKVDEMISMVTSAY